MGYSYGEAKAQINKIKAATADYQSSINKVQSQLVSKMSDLSNLSSRISSDIGQSDIVAFSTADVTKISNSISESLSTSASALSTLSRDATDEIKRIVDEYNSSIQYDKETGKPKSPRLSYETISLSSIAGVSAPSSSGGNGGGRNTGGGGYYGNRGNTTPTTNFTPTSFNDCLSMLGSGSLYSNTIDNWDSYVNDFLSSNSLSDSVESITIEGTIIKCKLKNGKVITLSNVFSATALANEIRKSL